MSTSSLRVNGIKYPDGTNAPTVFNVKDPAYGAKGDGTTDDTAAIQAAINACSAGGIVHLPIGTYKITTMLDVNNRSGVTVEGSGQGQIAATAASVLKWAGASGGTVFRVYSTQWSIFRDFTIDGNSLAGVGIDYTALNAVNTSQRNRFENITVRGITQSPSRNIHVGSSTNDQISETLFKNVAMFGGGTGIYQEGTQTDNVVYDQCLFSAYTTVGLDVVSGTVETRNCDFENATANTIDVRIGSAALGANFYNNYHELTNGNTQVAYSFTSGARFYATNWYGGHILYTSAAGGTVISYLQQGPALLSGVTFSSNAGGQGGAVTFAGSGSTQPTTLIGCSFFNSNTLSAASGTTSIMRVDGNGYIDRDGVAGTWPLSRWITPTLLNSWVNFGTPNSTAGYRKDATGKVTLKGLVKLGSSAAATIMTLPSGFRPAATILIPAYVNGGSVAMQIDNAGNVGVGSGTGSTVWTSLDGISFQAEQ